MEFFEKLSYSYTELGISLSILLIIHELINYSQKREVGVHFYIAIFALIVQIRIYSSLLFESSILSLFSGFSLFMIVGVGPMQYLLSLKMFGLYKNKDLLIHSQIIILYFIFELFLFVFIGTEFYTSENYLTYRIMIIIVNCIIYSNYYIRNRQLHRELKEKYEINYSNIVYLFNLNFPISFLLGNLCLFRNSKLSLLVLSFYLTSGGLSVILYLLRYPDFFNALSYEVLQKKYEKTKLPDENLQEIKKLLEELMQNKKLYKDEDLRIDDIANKLMINRNQLSRVLNEHYNKNFFQFLNHYRIQEAKHLLVYSPQMSILDIVFEVGFKSKSSFYKNFQEATGKSPKAYRENPMGKEM